MKCLLIALLLFAAPAFAEEVKQEEKPILLVYSSDSFAECVGWCGNEQGMCIAHCQGDGSCIARCAEAHGRCVDRCQRQR